MMALSTMSVSAFAQTQKAAIRTPEMKVVTIKNEKTVIAPSENFTGSVRVTMVAKGEDPSSLGCGYVEFQAGARSNWHTHPKGQLLIVTLGEGRVQEWGKPVQTIKPGDIVWTPAGVKHWHGASPKTAMTHAAVTESAEGKTVSWMELVTDAQYNAN
ncbi:MAG: cupin domain-containing protein [Proteobacteria bacterium]|nr:MAG: cupin domain-containing protein [Pseudomonadota bacterium]